MAKTILQEQKADSGKNMFASLLNGISNMGLRGKLFCSVILSVVLILLRLRSLSTITPSRSSPAS